MTKIEGVPDGYELVRIGSPKKDEAFIVACSNVGHAPHDFCGGGYAIVRKIEPPKPIEPPQGYRLLTENDTILITDKWWHFHKYWDDLAATSNCLGHKWNPVENTAMCRKIEPKVRPMTRDEFLAAWKHRWFCPLIDHEDDIDIVLGVIDEPTEFDPEIVNTDKHGWLSLDVLSGFKFASDETYLTVEE